MTEKELELLTQQEMDEWNHPDNVAHRNRNGCEFEREYEGKKYSFWDLRDDMEEM